MLVFIGGGGGGTLVGNGVVVVEGGEKLTYIVLHYRLEPYTKVQVQHANPLSIKKNL